MGKAREALSNGAMYLTKAHALDVVGNDTVITTVIIADFDKNSRKESVVSMSREEYVMKRTDQRNGLSINRKSSRPVDDFGGMF